RAMPRTRHDGPLRFAGAVDVRDVELDAAVAGPPLRGAVGVDRPVLAVPDALQTRGVDALLDEEAHDRIGAALRQATIRLRPALRIGVSLDAEVDLFGNLADDGGDVAQELEAAPVDRVAVAL